MSNSNYPRLREYILEVLSEAKEPLTALQIADQIPEDVTIVKRHLEEFLSDSVIPMGTSRWALKTTKT